MDDDVDQETKTQRVQREEMLIQIVNAELRITDTPRGNGSKSNGIPLKSFSIGNRKNY